MNIKLNKFYIIVLVVLSSITAYSNSENTLSNNQSKLIVILETLTEDSKNIDALKELKSLEDKVSELVAAEWFYSCYFVINFINNDKDKAKKSYKILKKKYLDSDAFSVANMNNMYDNCEKCNGKGYTLKTCPECKNNGRCVHCKGRGYIPYMRLNRRDPCSRCEGSGRCKTCKGNCGIKKRCTKCNGKKRHFSKNKLQEVYDKVFENALQYANGFVKHEGKWITRFAKSKIDEGYIFYDNEWLFPTELKERKLAAYDYEGYVDCPNKFLTKPPATGIKILKDKIVEYCGLVIPGQECEDGKIYCISWQNKYSGFAFWLAPKYSDDLLNVQVHDVITIRGVHTGLKEEIEMKSRDITVLNQINLERLQAKSKEENQESGKTEKEVDVKYAQATSTELVTTYNANIQLITNAQIVIERSE